MKKNQWCKKHKIFLFSCGCPDPRAIQPENEIKPVVCKSSYHRSCRKKDFKFCPKCGGEL